jgi:hypothetical protein
MRIIYIRKDWHWERKLAIMRWARKTFLENPSWYRCDNGDFSTQIDDEMIYSLFKLKFES